MVQQKIKIESLNIGLASPIRIRKWAERILPNGKKIGQVTNSKTVNYKTLKPEIGGLFCEKIFGPIKDFECLCGFKKIKFKTQNKFCPNCDVEFTASQIRRYRLGYIKLASPVAHIWYLRGRPRFLNILFDMAISLNKGKIKDLKPIIYSIDAMYLTILTLVKSTVIQSLPNSAQTNFFRLRPHQGSFLMPSLLNLSKISSKSLNANGQLRQSPLQNTFFSLEHQRVAFESLETRPTIDASQNTINRSSKFIKPKTTPILTLQNRLNRKNIKLKTKSTKQNKFTHSKIQTYLLGVTKSKIGQRKRPEISFNLIKPKFVSQISNFQFLVVLNFSEYQMINFFAQKIQNCKKKTVFFSSETLPIFKASPTQFPINQIILPVNSNKLKTLASYNDFYFASKPEFFFQKQYNQNYEYLNRTLKNNFVNYFYKKQIFFSQQLGNTFCNSYYFNYNLTTSQTSNRKKKLNEFLKKKIYIKLKKSQKTRIFLFDQNIFLNKKILQNENKIVLLKNNHNISTNLCDLIGKQSLNNATVLPIVNINFNSTYLNLTQNFQQQKSFELDLINFWKPNLVKHKNCPEALQFFKASRASLKNDFFINQVFSNSFSQIYTCGTVGTIFTTKLENLWVQNKKTLIQFLFSIFTLTTKKKIIKNQKNKNIFFKNPAFAEKSSAYDAAEKQNISSVHFQHQKIFLSQKKKINNSCYFSAIERLKIIPNKNIYFNQVNENFNQNYCIVQKTKVKLNLFLSYCFKKKNFVNFNGKIVSIIKIRKKQTLNLLKIINLSKQTLDGRCYSNVVSNFFNTEDKVFSKMASMPKQPFEQLRLLSLLKPSIFKRLIHKKNYSGFLQLQQNQTIFLLQYNFAFKPKSSVLNKLRWSKIKQNKIKTTSWNFISQNLVKIYVFNFFQRSEKLFSSVAATRQNNKVLTKTKFKTNISKTGFRLYYKTYFLVPKKVFNYSRFLVLLKKNRNCEGKLSNQFRKLQLGYTNSIIFRTIFQRSVEKLQSCGTIFNLNVSFKKLSKVFCNSLLINPNSNGQVKYKNILCNLRFSNIELKNNKSQLKIYQPLTSFPKTCSQILFDFSIVVNKTESQINSYYPVYSNSIFKFIEDEKKKKFEFKELWESFVTYITATSTEQDIQLFFYSNRLEKINLIKNQIPSFGDLNLGIRSESNKHSISVSRVTSKQLTIEQYKYVKRVLTGTEAIFYWLASLNLFVLKTKFKSKIDYLDTKINQFRQRSFLYDFQKKLLKKIIKIRQKIVKLMKLFYFFKKNKCKPEWLMVSILPVLPPTLRPIIQLDANQIAVSDLNQLYKRVLYRNQRIEKYLKKNEQADSNEIRFHQRLLQEAVDALLDNGKGGSQLACSPSGRPFKSLSEVLKGKKGRFRQNLLGKRVDYSGRSVIIVGPNLKLHQCGLPKEIALELFQPFLIRDLRNLHRSFAHFQSKAGNLSGNQITDRKITIIKAKKLIKKKHPIIWKFLEKILKNHPILLNRAPTLHRLGIQAFQPKLIEGKAIILHPLVCSAFNADFDGDQMAVHVPLCFQARAEAWKLMWSRNNLLSPATGEPSITPSQDMVLGCYYLTTKKAKSQLITFSFLDNKKIAIKYSLKKSKQSKNLVSKAENIKTLNCQSLYFNLQQVFNFPKSYFLLHPNSFNNRTILNKCYTQLNDVLIAFFQKKISIHSLVWVKWKYNIETDNFNEKPLEIRVDCYGNSSAIYSQYFENLNNKNKKISQFILTTVGRIILNKIILENIFF